MTIPGLPKTIKSTNPEAYKNLNDFLNKATAATGTQIHDIVTDATLHGQSITDQAKTEYPFKLIEMGLLNQDGQSFVENVDRDRLWEEIHSIIEKRSTGFVEHFLIDLVRCFVSFNQSLSSRINQHHHNRVDDP